MEKWSKNHCFFEKMRKKIAPAKQEAFKTGNTLTAPTYIVRCFRTNTAFKPFALRESVWWGEYHFRRTFLQRHSHFYKTKGRQENTAPPHF